MADLKVDVTNSAYGARATRLCGLLDYKAVITVVNGSQSQTDTITINGTACQFVSDATPTKNEIATGLAAAVNANAAVKDWVYASVNATDDLVVKSKRDATFTCTGSANLAVTSSTADLPLNPNPDNAAPLPAVFLGVQPEATTTGTLTLKDSLTGVTKLIIPIGVTVAAPYKVDGLKFPNGVTITPSAIGDRAAILWKEV